MEALRRADQRLSYQVRDAERLAPSPPQLPRQVFLQYGGQRADGGLGRRRAGLKLLERAGQGYLWFGLPIAVLLLSHDVAARRDAETLLAAMLLDLALVAGLKACGTAHTLRLLRSCARQGVLRRPRPPYMVPDMLIISVDKFSFPSGAPQSQLAADCS